MADVRRTVAALQTLLANNTAGDIGAQDARDVLVSCAPAYGGLTFSSPAATTISVAGTYYKAAGTTASVGASSDVTVATSNRITYTAAPTLYVIAFATASFTCASGSQVLGLSIAKSGSDITTAHIGAKIGTGTDEIAMSTFALMELAQNAYVEMFLTNETSTGAVTVAHGKLLLLSILV